MLFYERVEKFKVELPIQLKKEEENKEPDNVKKSPKKKIIDDDQVPEDKAGLKNIHDIVSKNPNVP